MRRRIWNSTSLRAKRSNPSRRAKEEWIASSRSLSSGARSRDPLAPRNDGLGIGCLNNRINLMQLRPKPGSPVRIVSRSELLRGDRCGRALFQGFGNRIVDTFEPDELQLIPPTLRNFI